jgi:hypothetical protein
MIGIDELHAQARRQAPSDGRLACAHQSDQGNRLGVGFCFQGCQRLPDRLCSHVTEQRHGLPYMRHDATIAQSFRNCPRQVDSKAMGFFTKLFMLLIVVIVVGGGAFLMTWDIPPPTSTVEKIIPDDRFTD